MEWFGNSIFKYFIAQFYQKKGKIIISLFTDYLKLLKKNLYLKYIFSLFVKSTIYFKQQVYMCT